MMSLVLLQSAEISAEYVKWLTIFVGLLALALVVQAIAVMIIATKVVGILSDVKQSFDETKGKALPLIAKISDLTNTTHGMVSDLVPKVKIISEDAVEMSHIVRQTVTKLDITIRDAADKASVTFAEVDSRTKVQVARVDGMVADTLSTTAEIGATITEGIRAPIRRIAAMITQSKHLIETLVDRAKTLGFAGGPTVQAKTRGTSAKTGL